MTKKEIKRMIKGYINTNNVFDFDSDNECNEEAEAKLTSLVKAQNRMCAGARVAKINGHYRVMVHFCFDPYDFTVKSFSIGGMETRYYKINDFVNTYAG